MSHQAGLSSHRCQSIRSTGSARACPSPVSAETSHAIAPGVSAETPAYDTGALVAAERNNRRMWALHVGYLAEEVIPAVPAPVLAEAWRGGSRQANLVRFLRMCDIVPLSEDLARHVGVLAGKSGHEDIVDVTVVEGAIRRGDAIVTSNVTQIRKVAEAAPAELRIESV